MPKYFTVTKTGIYFDGTIANGNTEAREFVYLGNFLLTGMVKSNQALTLRIEEGIEINAKTYIKTTNIAIAADVQKDVEHLLLGSYAKISLINGSGSDATVVASLNYRNDNIILSGITTALKYEQQSSITTLETNNTPINDGSSYTSPSWFDVSEYKDLSGMVTTDQDGTFKVQFSEDGSTPLAEDSDTYTADDLKGFTVEKIGRYARFVFTNNSGSNQTSFNYVLYGRK